MENYLNNISSVTNATELCNLICNIGLHYDERDLYGEYKKFMNPKGQGGLWQNPMELATFLIDNKQLFIDTDIKSYLDIGTFTGFTTFVIVEFLRAHVNKDIRVKTIDPNIWFKNKDSEPYISTYYNQCTIYSIKEEYDLVFIDGLHEHPGPMNDFNFVKKFAKIVFFHDISDKHCPDVVETFNKLSRIYESRRTCLNQGVFGIGILKLV
jgi:hypothetical protein